MTAAAERATLSAPHADLLRAAFRSDASAVASWRRWRERVDWDAHLPRDEFRLMPGVARNLRRLGADDPLFPRFSGIARQAWVANQHRLLPFQPALRALALAGARLAPLPPHWLLLHDAAAVEERHSSIACAVHPASVDAAARCLWDARWRPDASLPRWRLEGALLVERELVWHDGHGLSFAFAWQRDGGDPQGSFPDATWARARPARLANVPVLALDVADALGELCRRPPPGDTFASAVELLLHLDAAGALSGESGTLAARVPVDAAWRHIAGELCAIVPELPDLFGREEARATPSPGRPVSSVSTPRGIGARVAAHWSEYRRAWGPGFSLPAALWRLPGYLMAKWRLTTPLRLPIRAWRGLRWEWRESRAGRR